MKEIRLEWQRRVISPLEARRGRFAALVALAVVAFPMPMAVFGQPLDAIVGWLGLSFLIVGIIVAFYGLLRVGTKAGRVVLGTGAGLVVFMVVILGIFGVPGIPTGSFGVTTPGGTGGWQLCMTNVKYASLGIGTCVATANALLTETKGNPAPASASLKFVYWNFTLTPPPGSTQSAFNIIITISPPPSVTNTSNPTTTGPSIALTGSGQYNVVFTPASGTATTQLVIVPVTPGTAKVVAVQIQYAPILAQLALTQYPFGLTFTVTCQDQASGASIGSMALTTTVN